MKHRLDTIASDNTSEKIEAYMKIIEISSLIESCSLTFVKDLSYVHT